LIRWRSFSKDLRRRDAREACDPERIVRRGDRLTRTISEITSTIQVAWLGLLMLSNSVSIDPALKSPPKAIGSGRKSSFLGCLAYSMHELLLHVPTNAPQLFVFGTGRRIRQSPRKIDFSGLELERGF
jgi:hypothetical protein